MLPPANLRTSCSAQTHIFVHDWRVSDACFWFNYVAGQDEWLKQYNARKANIETAEKAMWDEELALHAVDPRVAEAAVYRQRELDWKFRAQPGAHARAMMEMQFPFIGKMREMK